MATLDQLKRTLREKAAASPSSSNEPLTDVQYDSGFNIVLQGSQAIYDHFIVPQLSDLIARQATPSKSFSVLEVGPGPKSVLALLPEASRRRIASYTAYEPNGLFATKLEQWLCHASDSERPFTCLQTPPYVHRASFPPENETMIEGANGKAGSTEQFDLVLFCHSMYGMKKREVVEQALGMLVEKNELRKDGVVVVFHRDGNLHLDGLVCHQKPASPPESCES